MKTQGNITSPKACNSSITEFKDTEMAEILDKEFKSLICKMINDFKEDSTNTVNEERKLIQYLDEKVSNMDEKFSEEIEILKKKTKQKQKCSK
jgi:hypothetical protein